MTYLKAVERHSGAGGPFVPGPHTLWLFCLKADPDHPRSSLPPRKWLNLVGFSSPVLFRVRPWCLRYFPLSGFFPPILSTPPSTHTFCSPTSLAYLNLLSCSFVLASIPFLLTGRHTLEYTPCLLHCFFFSLCQLLSREEGDIEMLLYSDLEYFFVDRIDSQAPSLRHSPRRISLLSSLFFFLSFYCRVRVGPSGARLAVRPQTRLSRSIRLGPSKY